MIWARPSGTESKWKAPDLGQWEAASEELGVEPNVLRANKRRRSPVCGADTAPCAASSKWSAARLPSRRRLSLAAIYFSLKTWKQTSIAALPALRENGFPF